MVSFFKYASILISGIFIGLFLGKSFYENQKPEKEVVIKYIKEPVVVEKKVYAKTSQTTTQKPKNEVKTNSFAEFKSYIQNAYYEEALAIYEEHLSENNSNYVSYLYNFIFSKLETNKALAKKLLNRVLELESENFYFTYLYLRLDYLEENYEEALKKAVNLKNSYIPEKFEQAVNQDFRNIAFKIKEQLKVSYDKEKIKEFIEFLTYHEEDSMAHILQRRLDKIYKEEEKQEELERLAWQKKLDDQKIQEQKERLAKLHDVQIPLIPYGNHFVVEARINDEADLKLLIDTGASGISIKKEAIEGIYFPMIKQNVSFSTANGTIKKNIYSASSFQVENVVLENMPFGVLENYNSSLDGLLGMDFLNKFDWKIDRDNSILFLNKK